VSVGFSSAISLLFRQCDFNLSQAAFQFSYARLVILPPVRRAVFQAAPFGEAIAAGDGAMPVWDKYALVLRHLSLLTRQAAKLNHPHPRVGIPRAGAVDLLPE